MGLVDAIEHAATRSGTPALVFLHEGLGSARLWRGLPGRLAARTGCEALAYSREGNGFSPVLAGPRTARYMHDAAEIELPRLLLERGLEDVVLIGHSDGASIALIYAALYPNRVRGVVAEAPHLFVEDLSLRSIRAIRERYEGTPLRERMARHHADVDRTFYGWNDVWLSPEFRDWNIEDYVRRVRAPVLAVQGDDDEYGTYAQIESLARLAVDVDQLRLARCGHAPHAERPALVEAAIADWIGEILS